MTNSGSIALTEITEENNYYPFGLKHKGYNDDYSSNRNAVATKFKYNGKELNDELGLDLYDYGARMYDASLGRWQVIDPVSNWAYDLSPYRYGFNNPILYIDRFGLFETRKEARKYKRKHKIKGRVTKRKEDGVFSIDNRKAKTSIWNDPEFGMTKGALVVGNPDRVYNETISTTNSTSGGISFFTGVVSEILTSTRTGSDIAYFFSNNKVFLNSAKYLKPISYGMSTLNMFSDVILLQQGQQSVEETGANISVTLLSMGVGGWPGLLIQANYQASKSYMRMVKEHPEWVMPTKYRSFTH